MNKGRLEAFSDGVIAVIITIMVLELKAPHGDGVPALTPLVPVFLSYVLSFVYVGIYWNNHHHMLHVTAKVTGGVLWANLHLLFWLSLFPFTTAWMSENHFASAPSAVYGFVLLMAAIAYWLLQQFIIAVQGSDSLLHRAIGSDWKGKLSPVLYLAAIPLAFVSHWIAQAIYVAVALIWLVPGSAHRAGDHGGRRAAQARRLIRSPLTRERLPPHPGAEDPQQQREGPAQSPHRPCVRNARAERREQRAHHDDSRHGRQIDVAKRIARKIGHRPAGVDIADR